jgi:hypothetical protein
MPRQPPIEVIDHGVKIPSYHTMPGEKVKRQRALIIDSGGVWAAGSTAAGTGRARLARARMAQRSHGRACLTAMTLTTKPHRSGGLGGVRRCACTERPSIGRLGGATGLMPVIRPGCHLPVGENHNFRPACDTSPRACEGTRENAMPGSGSALTAGLERVIGQSFVHRNMSLSMTETKFCTSARSVSIRRRLPSAGDCAYLGGCECH